MESFSRGWSFLQQAWGMAFKDKDLLKPSVYALVVGMIVSVIGIIPLAIAYFIFGGSQAGNFILFILGGILVFAQFVVTYVFSGMTVYLIYGYLSEGDGRMDKAWAIVQRDFFDVLTLAAASPAVNTASNTTPLLMACVAIGTHRVRVRRYISAMTTPNSPAPTGST